MKFLCLSDTRRVNGLKSKSELIETAMALDTDRDHFQLYSYAASYLKTCLLGEETKDFFAMVTTLMNNSEVRSNAAVIGFSGAGSAEKIKKWCSYILSRRELRSLSKKELHYVMAYCARLAKIHKEGC